MLEHPSRGIFHCQGWGGLHDVICADLTCDSVTLMSCKFVGSDLGVSSRKELWLEVAVMWGVGTAPWELGISAVFRTIP